MSGNQDVRKSGSQEDGNSGCRSVSPIYFRINMVEKVVHFVTVMAKGIAIAPTATAEECNKERAAKCKKSEITEKAENTVFEKKNSESPESNESTTKLLANTFNHIRHPYQVFIIPITIWSGLEQGFLGADFTAAYVSCGLGVHMVGYVMICYGLCDAVCSYSFTPLVKAVGRVPVFSMGAVINLGVIITLKYWTPRPDDLAVFFVLSGLWGVADAVWQTQINGSEILGHSEGKDDL
ncbi:UNC93-like protein [Penaeus japonicus]|uniref:UNC93-like protein n=1 Tax=Penaeus japonicus TaxID=27405 RepID=UPI001C714EFA|nr:UNC93-like protein [Penaeus japonicus]